MEKTILIIDDDEMNCKMARYILEESQEFYVLEANSGMEGLSVLQNENVDLVLLDIEMPVMNGFDTLSIIRKTEKMKDIPVMFLTAAADEKSVVKAGKLHADGYVKKPFFPDDLTSRVKRILGGW